MMYFKSDVACMGCGQHNGIIVKAVLNTANNLQILWDEGAHFCNNCRYPLNPEKTHIVGNDGHALTIDETFVLNELASLRAQIEALKQSNYDLERTIQMANDHAKAAFDHAVKAEVKARNMSAILL